MWNKRARAGEDLQDEARGVAKAKQTVAPSKRKKLKGMTSEQIKKAQVARARHNAASRGKEATDPCEDSPWHGRAVRVIRESFDEGLMGYCHERHQV